MRNTLIAILSTLFISGLAFSHGLEFKITLSGKVLLGAAYRYQIDPNTAVRVGGFMGVAGAPVGAQISISQDFLPLQHWTPTFGVGLDAILFKKKDFIGNRIMPNVVCGISYAPEPNLRHSGELWLGVLNHTITPLGMSYLYFSKLF